MLVATEALSTHSERQQNLSCKVTDGVRQASRGFVQRLKQLGGEEPQFLEMSDVSRAGVRIGLEHLVRHEIPRFLRRHAELRLLVVDDPVVDLQRVSLVKTRHLDERLTQLTSSGLVVRSRAGASTTRCTCATSMSPKYGARSGLAYCAASDTTANRVSTKASRLLPRRTSVCIESCRGTVSFEPPLSTDSTHLQDLVEEILLPPLVPKPKEYQGDALDEFAISVVVFLCQRTEQSDKVVRLGLEREEEMFKQL